MTDAAAAAVANASVVVKNANGQTIAGPVTTDANGLYTMNGVPSGAHTLDVDDAGTVTSLALNVVGTDPVTPQTVDVAVP